MRRPPKLHTTGTADRRADRAAVDRARKGDPDRRFLQSREWRERIKPAILARDGYLCPWCRLLGRVVAADQVDHKIRPRGDKVLQRDPDNLRSLCADHHQMKSLWERRENRSKLLRIGTPAAGWPVEVDPLAPGRGLQESWGFA